MAYSMKLTLVDDRTGLIIMASLFSAITVLAVALRFYSRQVQRTWLGADDWLALASLVRI
jgi:hypothetical protein